MVREQEAAPGRSIGRDNRAGAGMTDVAVAIQADAQLIKTIKTHIEKGDKAKDKAEQHYIAAGQHLKQLKEQHDGSWAEWEALLKERVGIGKSRASELMQIADGRKAVEQVREDGAKRVREHRESSPLRNGEGRGCETWKGSGDHNESPGDECSHAVADSGFDEDGAPIWICRGCGDEAPRSCGCHPCTATARRIP
jgi:hypothetical protein